MLKSFTIQFKDLINDYELRNDEKFHSFLYFNNWNLFDSKNNLVKFKDVLISDYKIFNFEKNKEYKGIPTGQRYLDEDGEIIDFQIINEKDRPNRLKYKIDSNNILISSLRLSKSPVLNFKNIDFDKHVFSNGFYIFKVGRDWNKKFILHILRSKRLKNILDNHIYRGIGISSYKQDDLLKIKIPLISKQKQDEIAEKIIPIENNIKKLKNKIEKPQDIINEVFADEFNFDLDKFEEIRKERFFKTNFGNIGKNNLLALKIRYYKFNINYLKKVRCVKLKKMSKFIKSGNAEKYEESIEDGNYISVEDLGMAGNVSSLKTANSLEHLLKIDDILFGRVGSKLDSEEMPIGIVKNSFQKFASDNILIIRLKENNIENNFVMYFLKSIFANYQIRKIVKTKGQPVINSTSLGNVKIPNISLSHQNKIVDKIKSRLDKQEEIKKEIEIERNKIDKIIELVVK